MDMDAVPLAQRPAGCLVIIFLWNSNLWDDISLHHQPERPGVIRLGREAAEIAA